MQTTLPIRPSEVYTGFTREQVREYLKREGWRVVGFRQLRDGDHFLHVTELRVSVWHSTYRVLNPLLILERV